jgi:hypothetical protein
VTRRATLSPAECATPVVDSLALLLTVIVSVEIEDTSTISILESSLGVVYSEPQIVILNLPELGNKEPSPVATTILVSSESIAVARVVLALFDVLSQS